MFKAILEECLEQTQRAGALIEQNWHKPHIIHHKGAIDLVTETDFAVQTELQDSLAKILPEAAFIGEESKIPWQQRVNDSLTWIVDPVDGTTNFVHRLPFVAISVALCKNGKPVVGIVHAPILKETFWAIKGGGAFLNGEVLQVSNVKELRASVCATGFPYEIKADLPHILQRLERVLSATQGLRRFGSAALDLAYIAAGRLDLFYETSLKPWDMAAGWLLVTESGGKVSDFAGEDFVFGASLLASNGHIHASMVRLLNS